MSDLKHIKGYHRHPRWLKIDDGEPIRIINMATFPLTRQVMFTAPCEALHIFNTDEIDMDVDGRICHVRRKSHISE